MCGLVLRHEVWKNGNARSWMKQWPETRYGVAQPTDWHHASLTALSSGLEMHVALTGRIVQRSANEGSHRTLSHQTLLTRPSELRHPTYVVPAVSETVDAEALGLYVAPGASGATVGGAAGLASGVATSRGDPLGDTAGTFEAAASSGAVVLDPGPSMMQLRHWPTSGMPGTIASCGTPDGVSTSCEASLHVSTADWFRVMTMSAQFQNSCGWTVDGHMCLDMCADMCIGMYVDVGASRRARMRACMRAS